VNTSNTPSSEESKSAPRDVQALADTLNNLQVPSKQEEPGNSSAPFADLSQAELPKAPIIQAETTPQPATLEKPPAAAAEEKAIARAERKFDRSRFVEPAPSEFLMDFVTPLNRYMLLQGIPVLRHIPLINSIPGVSGLMKVPNIDFPEAEIKAMREVINPGTVAFVGPNHPEFFTDWLIDKEIASRVSPYMAHWAAHEIVNSDPWTQSFWLKNNLIANVSNGGGKEYSHKWALAGHGVLLHPEGTVHWSGDRVQQIFPGIVDMALDAARALASNPADTRPVYVVPVVWKLNFNGDVSRGLQTEIRTIERKLNLHSGEGLSVIDRFYALQRNILLKQEAKFGVPDATRSVPITGETFFARQEGLMAHLEAQLAARYGAQNGDPFKRAHLYEKASKPLKDTDYAAYKEDREKITELRRLLGFRREIYNTPELSQENIAESLKRIRKDLVTSTALDNIKKTFPVPVGERTAHIRLAGPIEVRSLIKPGIDEATLRADLIKLVQSNMQSTLDDINGSIAAVVKKHSKANPFYVK
jgi:hypothetical protein